MLSTTDYREVFGDWLSQYAWTHWGTFTFRPYVPRLSPGLAPPRFTPSQAGPPIHFAHREWQRYVRRLERNLHRPIWWFRGDELGERLGRLHFHALIGGAMDYPPQVLAELWTSGFSKIVTYDPEKSAAYYVTKYVVKGLADWDVSARLVRMTGAL